jgi:osmotically-inducible protein OsmY
MQPFGTHPIRIVVNNGRTMLLGIADNDSDKTLAGVGAREINGRVSALRSRRHEMKASAN